MRVYVKFHNDVEPELNTWFVRMVRGRGGSREFAEWSVRELVRQLKETEGKPERAFHLRGKDTEVWVWKFSESVWIQYQFRDVREGFLRRRARHILITRIAENLQP